MASNVVPLPAAQARKLFSDMAESPFMTLCFIDGGLRAYTKGLDPRANELIRRLLHLLEEEEANGQE